MTKNSVVLNGAGVSSLGRYVCREFSSSRLAELSDSTRRLKRRTVSDLLRYYYRSYSPRTTVSPMDPLNESVPYLCIIVQVGRRFRLSMREAYH